MKANLHLVSRDVFYQMTENRTESAIIVLQCVRRAYDRKYELWQLRFLEEKSKHFFITTFGRDVCGQLSLAEEKLSKFMSTMDNHLIPSDLALAIWSF